MLKAGKCIADRGTNIRESLGQEKAWCLEELKKAHCDCNNPKSIWILVSKYHFSLTKAKQDSLEE